MPLRSQLTGVGRQAIVNTRCGDRGVAESYAKLVKITHDITGRV